MMFLARPGRRRWTAIAAAWLTLTSSVCSASSHRPAREVSGRAAGSSASALPAAPAALNWGGQWCTRPDVRCSEEHGLPVMALSRTDHPPARVLLVDVGGPGTSVENAVEQVSELGLWPRYDVLLVGEAWEVTPPPASCLTGESSRLAHYRALSGPSCDPAPWAFDPAAYREAVQATLRARHATLLAAVGISFGAVRVAEATPASVPLALITPAPPSGDFGAVAAARATALTAAAAKACGVAAACARTLRTLASPTLDDRAYATALALIASAADPTTFTRVARSLAGGSRALADGDLARLAYAATFRYADGAVLPNLLSYRGGTCGRYGGGVRPGAGGLESTLARVLSCPQAGSADTPEVTLSGRRGCVFVSDHDLVTPRALTAPWTGAGSGLRLAAGRVSGHARVDGTAATALAGLPGSLAGC
ncbi:MAG: hypothetical protein QOE23_1235 [Pseudonocardiales bacterium]|nr:hypothetical protein [Pseudonocardiales bacterium]